MTLDLKTLSTPFDPSAVHWRVQGQPFESKTRKGEYSAMALAYLDARDVMDRLDDVCGQENWQTEYHETPKGRLICRLSICIDGVWVTKSDGAGDTDVEGEKGAISDALKRAAVSWGIGRYLYRLESPWVPCEVKTNNGKTYWKKWKVDPWTMVKGAQPVAKKVAPFSPTATAALFNPTASAFAAIEAKVLIENAKDLPDLQKIWANLHRFIQTDHSVAAAKDKRKAELQPPPAMSETARLAHDAQAPE